MASGLFSYACTEMFYHNHWPGTVQSCLHNYQHNQFHMVLCPFLSAIYQYKAWKTPYFNKIILYGINHLYNLAKLKTSIKPVMVADEGTAVPIKYVGPDT